MKRGAPVRLGPLQDHLRSIWQRLSRQWLVGVVLAALVLLAGGGWYWQRTHDGDLTAGDMAVEEPTDSARATTPTATPQPTAPAGSRKAGPKQKKRSNGTQLGGPNAGQVPGSVPGSDSLRDLAQRLATSTSEPCTESTVDFTVLSYNIKSAYGGRFLGNVAQEVRAWGADAVLIQEIKTGRVNMPGVIAGRLGGWDYAFGQNVRYRSGGYGTAIISRYPILGWTNTHLPNAPGGQQRGLLNAVVDIHGVQVSLYDTHLQHKGMQALRTRQAGAINSIVSGDARPRVLGGDFNSQPGSPPMRVLYHAWADTWSAVGRGRGLTHPSHHDRGRIDAQLYNGAITPLSASVMDTSFSDHDAVRATYRVTRTC